ncbi:hypothetical protein SDC9_82387 [bioreactor metagenome]|uniref:Stage II sporulation protein R n=1 Tax=bioreactor metagenome TaxID=1076179 RepID=A0A644ZAQ3_9ZZZZ
MKKFLTMVVTVLVILTFLTGLYSAKNIGAANAQTLQVNEEEVIDSAIEDISQKLIRFHVIANSDEEKDQALKLKVRDEVLKYIQPMLKDSKDIDNSREILKRENENILNIARNVIKENGYSYEVDSTLSREYFPVKTYGNITLPQGEYEAYRILIGSGEGKNWWCVMFPPICFVDVTKGAVAYEETEKEMKEVLSEDEYKMVDNKVSEQKKNSTEQKKSTTVSKESNKSTSKKPSKSTSKNNTTEKSNSKKTFSSLEQLWYSYIMSSTIDLSSELNLLLFLPNFLKFTHLPITMSSKISFIFTNINHLKLYIDNS